MNEEIVTDKEKAEMVDDLAELFECQWFEVYSKAALAKEFKDNQPIWAEDRNEFPQKGLGK